MKLLLAWLLGVPVSIAGMMNVMSVDLRSALLGAERPAQVAQCMRGEDLAVSAARLAPRADCHHAAAPATTSAAAVRHQASR